MTTDDIPDMLGGAIDELMRHHPTTKDHFFIALKQLLDDIISIGQDFEKEDPKAKASCQLEIEDQAKKEEEEKKEKEKAEKEKEKELGLEAKTPEQKEKNEEEKDQPETLAVRYIHNISRVLFFNLFNLF